MSKNSSAHSNITYATERTLVCVIDEDAKSYNYWTLCLLGGVAMDNCTWNPSKWSAEHGNAIGNPWMTHNQGDFLFPHSANFGTPVQVIKEAHNPIMQNKTIVL